jgi:hypothetical protein
MKIESLEQAADCIRATNIGVTNAYKIEFARRLLEGDLDRDALEQIEADARRQMEACNFIRRQLGIRRRKATA